MTGPTKISYPKTGKLETHLGKIRAILDRAGEYEADTAEGAVAYMNKSISQMDRELTEIEEIIEDAETEDQ